MEKEIVFEVLAEGGSIKIERIAKVKQGCEYFLVINETDFSESGLDVYSTKVYDNFYDTFDALNEKYFWHDLHISYAEEDFKEHIAEVLINKLNKLGITQLNQKQLLEEKLNCKFNMVEKPEIGGLQIISVSSLIKVIEHDYVEHYDEYAKEIGQKYKLKGSYEMFTEEQPYTIRNMELINSSNSLNTIGNIEVSGNTIIIKDEYAQIAYVLPSDKYFISAKPAHLVKQWKIN